MIKLVSGSIKSVCCNPSDYLFLSPYFAKLRRKAFKIPNSIADTLQTRDLNALSTLKLNPFIMFSTLRTS